MKQKQLFIIIALVVVVGLLGGGGYVLYSRSSGPAPTPTPSEDAIVPTIAPEEIGLTLSAITSGRYADHGVEMKITKLADIASIDYELSYTSKGGIPRGAIGHTDIKSGQSTLTQQLYFGTCSDVCHPDSDVSAVKVTLKVTKNDGKTYQVIAPFNQ